MTGQLDDDSSVPDLQVGMVALRLSDRGNPVDKADSTYEVRQRVRLRQLPVTDIPSAKVMKALRYFVLV